MYHTHTRTIRKGYIASYLLTNVPFHIFSKERKKNKVVVYQIFNNRGYLFNILNILCDNSMIRMLSR